MLQTGSALLTVPAASAAGDFAVEFDTYFGGGSGSGGEGLSFSFGALPPTHFGEHGVSSALSIQLLSAEKRIEIWHAHSILAQTVGSVELRRGSFTSVSVTHGAEGLSVAIGGVLMIENVTLAGWKPSANWTMGFGARTGETNYDVHVVDNVRIRTGAAFRSHVVPVEVSVNGQENTQNAIGFSYFAEPTVSYLRFERGPTSGGTSVVIGGSSFRGGSVFFCRFGPVTVNATYSATHDELSCVSPAASAGGVPVEVSRAGCRFRTTWSPTCHTWFLAPGHGKAGRRSLYLALASATAQTIGAASVAAVGLQPLWWWWQRWWTTAVWRARLPLRVAAAGHARRWWKYRSTRRATAQAASRLLTTSRRC